MLGKLLFWLSGQLPCRLINDGARPYLERYYLGQLLGWTFYLHRFVDSDPARGLHDHPWSHAVSFVLAGSYLEETRAGVRRVRWFNRLTGDSFHRVVLPEGGRHVWTLFCHGPYVKQWGFMRQLETALDEDVLIWVPYHYGKDDSSGSKRWWERAPRGKNEARRMPA